MRIEHDIEHDCAYIYLTRIGSGDVKKTIPVDTRDFAHSRTPVRTTGSVNLDFDRDGRLVGIEVIAASALLPKQLLAPWWKRFLS